MVKILSLILGVLLTGGGLYVRVLKAENAAFKVAAAHAKSENTMLRQEIFQNFKALENRENQNRLLLSASQNLKQQLQEIYNHDQQIENWANQPVPDSVFERLRD
ncbi:MAG: hypothetical protein ACRCTY_02765 [Candidatus Adiutrix sp.]